jgi:predicted secreted protein
MIIDKAGVQRGRDLMLFRNTGTDTAPVWVALGAATSHSLSIQTDNADISNKDTAQFKTVLPGGNISWSISAECMYKLQDTADLIQDIIQGNVYKVAFALLGNPSDTGVVPPGGWDIDPDHCYLGNAFLSSLSANAPYEGQATYSAEFTGSGPLTKMSAEVAAAYKAALNNAAKAAGVTPTPTPVKPVTPTPAPVTPTPAPAPAPAPTPVTPVTPSTNK